LFLFPVRPRAYLLKKQSCFTAVPNPSILYSPQQLAGLFNPEKQLLPPFQSVFTERNLFQSIFLFIKKQKLKKRSISYLKTKSLKTKQIGFYHPN